MIEIVTLLLTQLGGIAGITSQVAVIGKIIAALTELYPVVVKEYEVLAPIVKGIIAALSANPAATAEQIAQLKVIDKQVDDAFDAAAAAAEAEDAAAGGE
jgi:hypothetical protein